MDKKREAMRSLKGRMKKGDIKFDIGKAEVSDVDYGEARTAKDKRVLYSMEVGRPEPKEKWDVEVGPAEDIANEYKGSARDRKGKRHDYKMEVGWPRK